MKKFFVVLPLVALLMAGCAQNQTSSSSSGSSSQPTTTGSQPTSTTSQPTSSIPPVGEKDTDFDGLWDSIDPDPNNNVYQYHFSAGMDKKDVIKDGEITFDYREFLKDDIYDVYNVNLARLASFMIQESYALNIDFKNNEYITEQSKISKLLVQLGCEDILKTNINASQYDVDSLDLINFRVGHHLVTDGEKKLNVFIVEMKGYDDYREWISNFDIGVDTPNFYDITGEHPEWTDTKAHKGFKIAADRAFQVLKPYMEEHAVDGVENFAFISGHSRSAAVGSLLAKNLKDNDIKSLAYLFNVPNHYGDISEQDAQAYTNIWELINTEDLVGFVPLKEWGGFTHLGHVLTYNLSTHADFYEEQFIDRNFPETDGKLVETLTNAILKFVPDRVSIFEFRPVDPNYEEVILDTFDEPFESEEDANAEIEELYNSFSNPAYMKKLISMQVTSKVVDSKTVYQINYRTMPQMIIALINEVIACEKTLANIIGIVTTYLPFLGRYLADIREALSYFVENLFDNITLINYSHEQNQTLIAPYLVELR